MIKSPDASLNSTGLLPSNNVSKNFVGTKHDVNLISVIESQEMEPEKHDDTILESTTLCQDF